MVVELRNLTFAFPPRTYPMRHPLEFFPKNLHKTFFYIFFLLTLVLFVVFRALDQPLQTDTAPHGIISFELAGNVLTARSITDSWKQISLLLSATGDPEPDIVNVAYSIAAFGLGLDYLFMPVYALALGFGSLLASQKHSTWLHSLSILAAYGAFAAATFDALENYFLFQILLGKVGAGYPKIAAVCAVLKFGLLASGIVVCVIGWLFPKRAG